MLSQFATAHTCELLDWAWVQDRLKEYAKTPPGVELCDNLPWASSPDEAELRLREVAEAMRLISSDAVFPLAETSEIRPFLLRLEKGAVLEASEILTILTVLECARAVRRFLFVHKAEAPTLFRYAEQVPDLGHLIHHIRSCFTPDGELADTASSDLGELRNAAQRLHRQILKRMSVYLSSEYYRDLIQDTYYTVKEDRYVLPIKSHAKAHVDGIVLGSSSSGATLFIEPREIVDLNNAHKLALLDIQKETQRILRSLCDQFRQHQEELHTSLDLLTTIDLINAKAQLSLKLKAHVPAFNLQGRVRLIQARHPILAFSTNNVVPNDIQIGPDFNTLILTGPNTGGKTVLLKTVGICALMSRAGLPIPAEQESTLPFFDKVFADIGDDQSIETNLSTFSSHIIRIRGMLESLHGMTLTLLDEIVIGTDPDEGAALAQAILEYLSEAGGITIATTHYLPLKTAASLNPKFHNASLGFDPETLSPSYNLYMGIPGTSNAMEIARRLGMPELILRKAHALQGNPTRELHRLLSNINRLRQDLEVERSALALILKENQELKEKLVTKLSDLATREKELKSTYRQRLDQEFSKARLELETWRRTLKSSLSLKAGASLRRELAALHDATLARDGVFADRREPTESAAPVDWSQVRCGDLVYLHSSGTEARILQMPDTKGSLLVEAGGIRVRVGTEDVAPLTIPRRTISASTPTKRTPRYSFQEDTSPPSFPYEPSTCDLRGLTVDEALSELVKCLDRGFVTCVPRIHVIHGLGTGALRSAVRQYLDKAPYALSYRAGRSSEGGDGVTIVEFEHPSFPDT